MTERIACEIRAVALRLAACCLLSMVGGTAAADQATLTFGIVPQQAASKLARLWAPILNDVGERTGYSILFKTARNIPEFERKLAQGEFDTQQQRVEARQLMRRVLAHHLGGRELKSRELFRSTKTAG